MRKDVLKTILENLSKSAFEVFLHNLFNPKKDMDTFQPLSEAGENVYITRLLDSYGGSIHAVHLFHSIPIEVFDKPKNIITAEHSLALKLKKLRELYSKEIGYWGMVSPCLTPSKKMNEFYFLNNFSGFSFEDYQNDIIPKYQQLLHKFKIHPKFLFVGRCDTFIEKNYSGTLKAIESLFLNPNKGVSISLVNERFSIDRFLSGKNICSGIAPYSKTPYEPLY